jgi:hypothetical protein
VIYYTQKIFTLSKSIFYFSNASFKSSRSLGGGGVIKFQPVILLFYDHLLNLRLMKPETKAEFCSNGRYLYEAATQTTADAHENC